MDEQEGRKQKNKDRITKAALELFELHGFKKVIVNDIAEKANVSPVPLCTEAIPRCTVDIGVAPGRSRGSISRPAIIAASSTVSTPG